jgi:hypothetical protein
MNDLFLAIGIIVATVATAGGLFFLTSSKPQSTNFPSNTNRQNSVSSNNSDYSTNSNYSGLDVGNEPDELPRRLSAESDGSVKGGRRKTKKRNKLSRRNKTHKMHKTNKTKK